MKSFKIIIRFGVIAVVSLLIAYFLITSKLSPSKQLKFMSMNTEVDVLIYDRFSPNVSAANADIFKLFSTLDSLWNPYDTLSEISAINRNAGVGKPLKVNPYTFELVSVAVDFNKNISPKFNIAVGPLIKLWRKAAKQNKKPCNCTVKRIRKEQLNNDKIILDSINQTIFLAAKKMKIDFGAIAKGYAQRKVRDIMNKHDIKFYIVNSGGDMYLSSKYLRKFSVGVINPFKKSDVKRIVKLKNTGVATSGDYERSMMIEGKKYSHIINPVTGLPQEDFNSSTVVHKDPLMADIWATTLAIEQDSLLMSKFKQELGGFILISKDTIINNL